MTLVPHMEWVGIEHCSYTIQAVSACPRGGYVLCGLQENMRGEKSFADDLNGNKVL